MLSEMGCMVTNVTVHTWQQKTSCHCRQVRMGPNIVYVSFAFDKLAGPKPFYL